MKPKMTLDIRISIDSSHKQRYTDEEIHAELRKCNVSIGKTSINFFKFGDDECE